MCRLKKLIRSQGRRHPLLAPAEECKMQVIATFPPPGPEGGGGGGRGGEYVERERATEDDAEQFDTTNGR